MPVYSTLVWACCNMSVHNNISTWTFPALLVMLSIAHSLAECGSTPSSSKTLRHVLGQDKIALDCDYGDGVVNNIYWFLCNGSSKAQVLNKFKGSLFYGDGYSPKKVAFDEDGSTLIVYNINVSDEGIYKCDVDRADDVPVLNIETDLRLFAPRDSVRLEILECSKLNKTGETCIYELNPNEETTLTCTLRNIYPLNFTLHWQNEVGDRLPSSKNDLRENQNGTYDATVVLSRNVTEPANFTCAASFLTSTVSTDKRELTISIGEWNASDTDFPSNGKREKLGAGAIAGIVVGSLLFAICIFAIICILCWKENREASNRYSLWIREACNCARHARYTPADDGRGGNGNEGKFPMEKETNRDGGERGAGVEDGGGQGEGGKVVEGEGGQGGIHGEGDEGGAGTGRGVKRGGGNRGNKRGYEKIEGTEDEEDGKRGVGGAQARQGVDWDGGKRGGEKDGGGEENGGAGERKEYERGNKRDGKSDGKEGGDHSEDKDGGRDEKQSTSYESEQMEIKEEAGVADQTKGDDTAGRNTTGKMEETGSDASEQKATSSGCLAAPNDHCPEQSGPKKYPLVGNETDDMDEAKILSGELIIALANKIDPSVTSLADFGVHLGFEFSDGNNAFIDGTTSGGHQNGYNKVLQKYKSKNGTRKKSALDLRSILRKNNMAPAAEILEDELRKLGIKFDDHEP